MMTDLFWDEVLLTNNPDSKELEVSFKKIDGDGFITSAGGEPGTPGGATEDPQGDDNLGDSDGDGVADGGNEGDQPGGTGGGIPPVYDDDTPNPCEPGIDCTASANLIVNSGSRAGVFGLYPASKANQQITTPLATSFGTIHQIQQGDGSLSGWSRGSAAFASVNTGLKNYLLSDSVSICGEDVDIVTGFPVGVYVTSEFLSGGAKEVYPYNRQDDFSFKQTANFVVYTDPSSVLGQSTSVTQSSNVTIRAAFSETTPNTTVSANSSASVQFVGTGAGNPHNIVCNGVVIGAYDFTVPQAKIVSVAYATQIEANWDTTSEDSQDHFFRSTGRGIITVGGTGGGASGGTTTTSEFTGPSVYPFYGTFRTDEASGLSRGVCTYTPSGVILSGGANGDDIELAVKRSVSTYQTPDYCSRIP